MQYTIANMDPDDWEYVCAIYLEGIAGGHSTFEHETPDWQNWNTTHLPNPRLVAKTGKNVLGWSALSPVSSRPVYSGVTEVSLYIAEKYRRRGIGSTLLTALIDASEQAGIWTLQGGIFPENIASLVLFRKHGFREVGRREKLGKMSHGELSGKWRDVILVERRSKIVE